MHIYTECVYIHTYIYPFNIQRKIEFTQRGEDRESLHFFIKVGKETAPHKAACLEEGHVGGDE